MIYPYKLLDSLIGWGSLLIETAERICVGNLTIISSNNGLSLDRRLTIIWSNSDLLPIGRLEIKLRVILLALQTFSFKKLHLEMSSAKWGQFCLGLSVLNCTHTKDRLYTNKQMENR